MTKWSLWGLKGFYHQDDKWVLAKRARNVVQIPARAKGKQGGGEGLAGTTPAPAFWERWGLTYQEGAEEDEGHEVEVGKVAAALVLGEAGERVAGPVAQARQHDLVPGLPRGAPAGGKQGGELIPAQLTEVIRRKVASRW